ncbi:MAG: DNA polymerase III subunit alpha [Alphaproteobacteria bacterium]|nr:DNA polymerase III subunit alpha [Alphaproteobacteria bacterium]
MPEPSFIHLRVHSAYSLAEGAIRVTEDKPKDGKPARQDLIHLCLKNHMPAVALTDKGNLFGALEFSQAAADAGIQPIIGCQLAVLRPEQASLKTLTRDHCDQLVLLVQNELGYRHLSALVTRSYVAEDRPFPYVTLEELAPLTGGLLALTGGTDGLLGHVLAAGQMTAAEAALDELRALFPDRLYVEVTRHHGGAVSAVEAKIEADLIDLAYRHNVPLVATNDVYFGNADMYEAHDALLCISDKTVLAETNRRHLTQDHYFKSAAEMRTLFADLPEACDNTVIIAKRCAYMPPARKPILPAFSTGAGRDEAQELRAQAEAGLKARLDAAGINDHDTYFKRLDFELKTITQMGFAGYFLIVSDFIKWSKKNGIAVGPGRGSGAGSVVAWSLLITDLDPLRFGLLFERFLNPERVSMPDFDIDFCQERRDEVIGYVQQKYGADRVAQIITFGKLQARAALRDVGRVLGMPYGYVDKICKLVPNNPANPVTLTQAIEGEPQLQQMRDDDPTVAQMMDIAIKLEGLYRNASTHAAGVVIGDRPLVELVPLYRDPDAQLPATQFNMKTVEVAGLVKFDFLGLKTLDVLQMAAALVKKNGGHVDLEHLPFDDAPTYALLSRGDTTGVFQLESSGMRDVLRKLKPNRFEDIIALVALYRPGPMDNIPKYIRCKNGEEEIDYLHPILKPILEDTFGIMIYQEQVMQAAQFLAGYSLGAADLLRRAMGKKKASEMAAQRANFIKGAGVNGVPEEQAGMIFDQIDKFAGYGFNKSHAAAYALIAYQTAYLKANYPAEFFAAAMNFEMGDTDKLNVFRQELARQRLYLLPPDINHSYPAFAIERTPTGGQAIRYALAAIKGVGMAAMQSLVAEREAGGPFKDLIDLAERIDPRVINRKQLENLTTAGAFDALNRNRAQVIAATEVILRHSHQMADEKLSGQVNMFGGHTGGARPALPAAKPWDDLTRLQHEFQSLGFYLSAHPLDNYRGLLDRMKVIPASMVAGHMRAGGPSRFKLAGIVLSKQERTAKSGNKFAFMQMSDTSGAFEVTIFSELLAAKRDIMEAGQALIIEVDAQNNNRGGGTSDGQSGDTQQRQEADIRYIARGMEPLAEAASRAAQGIRVKLYEPSPLPALKSILDGTPAGRGKIVLCLDLDGHQEAEMELPGGWQLSDALKTQLRAIGGGLEVQEW